MTVLSLDRFRCCTKCGVTWPAIARYFYRQKTGRYGLRSVCKLCADRAHRDLGKRPDTREKRRQYSSNNYYKHRENRLAQHAEYRETNREERREYDRQRVRTKKERLRERARIKADPELYAKALNAFRESRNRRRAQQRGSPGHHTASDIRQMYDDQHGLCAYCEVELDGAFHVEHMTPLSRGGSNDWSNIAIACAECNCRKHTRTAEEYVMLS